jgi:hypothetical protein
VVTQFVWQWEDGLQLFPNCSPDKNAQIKLVFKATSATEEVLSGVNLRDKRILVTGVSAGLGVETARGRETADTNLHLRHFSKTTFIRLIGILRRYPKVGFKTLV